MALDDGFVGACVAVPEVHEPHMSTTPVGVEKAVIYWYVNGLDGVRKLVP